MKSAKIDDFEKTSSFFFTEFLSSFIHGENNDDEFHHPIHDPFDPYLYPGQDLVIDESYHGIDRSSNHDY